MRNCRLLRCLVCPVFLIVLASGCHAFQHSREVVVQVRDAETGKPIAGAEVRIHYPLIQDSYAPPPSVAESGAGGIVRLKTAQTTDFTAVVKATASGYLCAAENLPVEMEPAEEKRPPPFVLTMFAGPRPTVELVLPTGYRGLVKVETRMQDDARCAAGQRLFRYEVPPSGTVLVVGPPLFRRSPPIFQARHAGGDVLPRQAQRADIAFWWVETSGPYEVYVVGTRDDFLALRPRNQEEEGTEPIRPAGGRGRGRGGRGGRGGGGGGSGGPSN